MPTQTKKTNIVPQPIGNDAIKAFEDMSNGMNSTNLPQSVLLEDLDMGFFNFVNQTHLPVNSQGKQIPVFFMTNERWANFEQTWKYSDDDGNVVMPFITVRRSEPPKPGSNANVKYRVAQNKKFTYLTVPTFNNGVYGADVYRMRQPVPVDLTYEVSIFTHYYVDLNTFNQKIQKCFASLQAYDNTKFYPIPIILESSSDESTKNDFSGQQFYSQTHTIIVMGFLQDTEDMEVVKGTRRVIVNLKEENKKTKNIEDIL